MSSTMMGDLRVALRTRPCRWLREYPPSFSRGTELFLRWCSGAGAAAGARRGSLPTFNILNELAQLLLEILDITSTSPLFCQSCDNFRRFLREGELGSGGRGPHTVRTWKSGAVGGGS